MDKTATATAFVDKAREAGVTEADIRQLIPAFYARLRLDPILGPVFEGIIGSNWESHIGTVCSFWLYVTRLDRHYNARNFAPAHLRQPAIRADLLPRWLAIFRETTHKLCTPAQADVLIDIAQRMVASLEISLNKRDSEAQNTSR